MVAYLRPNRIHSNIVQLCIANLSGAAAVGVSAQLVKITEWPDEFYFQDSAILRDLSYLRPHELLEFDLGVGPDLFRDGVPASFHATINYDSLDGRNFTFNSDLLVESVEGHSHFVIYTIDDVARRLKEISDAMRGFAGHSRLKVETYDSEDRELEQRQRDEQRERFRKRHEGEGS
ncbi:MAG TPA: hypothetical protein VFP12_13530 [Allosphingosinicella sp.]|nr:hypothetical protein [Allosphingosinicella sp.]